MCGIVGFAGKHKAINYLINGLEQLEYRGYDSAGIASVDENKKIYFKRKVGRIENLKKEIDESEICGNVGIGHTRWATHGKPNEQNSHPHFSNNKKFAVVHNGIIENFEEIKEELSGEGFKFYSETDTEVIPNLLQKYYKGDLKSAVFSMQKRLKGSFALGIICADYPKTLIAVRNFSPLILGIAEDSNIIASDVTAIASKTNKIIYIEDGDTAFITSDSVEIYSGTLMTERSISVIDWEIENANKNGYSHYMMKEICEQPDVMHRLISNYLNGEEIRLEKLKLKDEFIKDLSRVVFIGCGSAYHVGMVGKYVFEELLSVPCDTELASEFRYKKPVLSKETLVVAISQSGETADTIAAAKEAKQKGANLLSVVNVEESGLAKISDSVIYTLAGPEIAVATTKGYTSQLFCLYLLGIFLAEKMNKISIEKKKDLLNELLNLPLKSEEIIKKENEIAKIAENFKGKKELFFIGRNIDYAVCLEASLKLKEISYIHSEAFAAGELKHGTISLIEENTPVIAISMVANLREKLMSNVKEVEARGADVLILATKDFEDCKNNKILIPDANRLFSASLSVIPFQIFGFYVALYNNCDIDKPRNLAKSVTVE